MENTERVSIGVCMTLNGARQCNCFLLKKFIEPRLEALLELSNAGCHGDRISAERTRLINRSFGRHLTHDFLGAPICPNGKTTTDNFSEREQVGPDVVVPARAFESNPKTRDYFIKQQEGSFART